MAKLKLIISEPTTGKSEVKNLEGANAIVLVGRAIGESVDGSIVNMGGRTLLITGGTDKDGFPMRNDVHGGVKARVLLSGKAGFKPTRRGERRRKTVRGYLITEDTAQVNMKILPQEASKQNK